MFQISDLAPTRREFQSRDGRNNRPVKIISWVNTHLTKGRTEKTCYRQEQKVVRIFTLVFLSISSEKHCRGWLWHLSFVTVP